MRSRPWKLAAGLWLISLATPAYSSETITYTYDARGRLVKVEHSGSVNNNLKAEYSYDKADNRTNVKVTGSSASQASARLVVVPLNGYTTIFIR